MYYSPAIQCCNHEDDKKDCFFHGCYQSIEASGVITLSIIRQTLSDPLIEECFPIDQLNIDCNNGFEVTNNVITVLEECKLFIGYQWEPYNRHNSKVKTGIKKNGELIPCSLYIPNRVFGMQSKKICRNAVETFVPGDEIMFCVKGSQDWYGNPLEQPIWFFDLMIKSV